MKRAKHNLTLAVDGDLLRAARKVALEQGTSVNRLVSEYLTVLVGDGGRRRMAAARLKKVLVNSVVEAGEHNWTRDQLYDR